MAKSGEVLENPVTGQRIVFKQTSADTGGTLLEVESTYTKPTPSRPPVHYHPAQEETFEVLSGKLSVIIDGERKTLGEDETLVIPRGTRHTMWAENAGVRVNWQTRPALKTEAFFETIYSLARDGKTNSKGAPNLLQYAVIARSYAGEFRLASPPWPVQQLLFAILAPIGKLLGHRPTYPN
ncbi:MAG: cupin domain-containing protein [Rubrobacteraceae bacterium]|nr:cupin domain-containing protein [Rubrobacteraceae bacterium]